MKSVAVRRLISLILAAVIGSALAAFALPTDRADALSLSVVTNAATPSFPSEIAFSLVADAPADVERVELLYATAAEPTFHLATPNFSRGTHIDVSHQLDMLVNYQPPGVDITYHWRLTAADGTTIETEPATVLWQDDRFDWTTVSTDQVTVYAYNGNEEFNHVVLDSAQETIDRLQTDFGVDRSAPIRIWAYNSRKDFQGAQAPNSEPWIAGTAYPNLQLILAVLPEGDEHEVGRVVPHEISHQVLYQATRNPFNAPPTWLDEGLAVLNQDNGDEDFPAIVQDAADDGRLFSIRALNSQFPYDPADANLAYAESLSIVQFIIDQFGADRLGALIDSYRQGISHDDALVAALGVDMTELDRLWKESLGYAGDQAPAGGVHPDDETGTPFGDSLASGALVMAGIAIAVAVAGVVTLRRGRESVSELM